MTEFSNLIDVAELQRLLGSADCRLVDCRFDLMRPELGREQYLEGHIDGAVYADLNEDLAGPITASSGRHPLPSPHDFQGLLESWGLLPDMQVVVYDHASGAMAARLWWLLRWVGHRKVAVLNGGIAAWLAAGGSAAAELPKFPASRYAVHPNMTMVATSSEVLNSCGAAQAVLLDARDRPRFAGEIEPIDAKAGHVPGALNLPFSETVNADGTWRSPSELDSMWQQTLGEQSGRQLITMCGSGVTACHLLLTADLLGIEQPKLYVGSWSEWIRDETRPIETAGGG